MRLASFNLENLDLPLGLRGDVLRPALERLQADVVCLQEVNGQHVPCKAGRQLAALDELLAGTIYAPFHRAWTTAHADTSTACDVHNLVTLSRYPIVRYRQVRHDFVPAFETVLVTADPPGGAPVQVQFDRALLLTELDVGSSRLNVINVHLRAPLASGIPGQKRAPFVWKSAGGWAEGYMISGIKRMGQALELRLLLDELFDAEPHAWALAAGDFNAEAHETPVRIAIAAPEDTGNGELTSRSMVVLDRAIEASRRFSILHHGRPQMVDHMLASHALLGRFSSIEVHNEALGDEAAGYAKGVEAGGSYHAATVATFAI